MKYKFHTLFFIIALLFSSMRVVSQNTVACNMARNICPNPAFTFTSVSGVGLTPGNGFSNPIPNPNPPNGGCLPSNGINPEWLIITVTTSGNLGFVFGANGSPNPQTTYMHWIMWPYSPNACTNIFNNSLAPVACNLNSNASGGTGMGAPGTGFPGNFEASIPVTAGQQFLILVSNVSGIVKNVTFAKNGTADLACSPFVVPNATACPNQMTVVSSTWTGASALNYTIQSQNGAIPPVTQSSPNFNVSSPTTNVYTVTAQGVNAFGQVVRATTAFTLFVNPTTTMSVAHATNYCANSCASFSISPGNGVFNISGPQVTPITGGTTNTVITICNLDPVNQAGVYTFTANYSTGCSASYTTQVNIAPNVPLVVAGPNNPTAVDVCQNTTATFNANLPSATTYTLVGPCYNNTFPIGAPASGNFSLPNVQPNCAGNYTVNANIVYNTITCPKSSTIDIRVVETHSIDAQSSYTLCEGTPACVTASAVGTTTNSFTWAGPPNYPYASTVQNPCITNSITTSPNPNMAGTYVVTANFSNGFKTCQTTANVNIQVVSVPAVSVIVPTIICQYATANMAVFAGGNAPTTTYMWQGPNNFTWTTDVVNIQNIQPAASGVYTVHVVYSLGTRTCGAVGYNQITVVPVNSVSINSSPPVCYPDNVYLYANAVSATSFSWAGPNSYTAGTGATVLYYPPLTASGVYTAYASFNNGGIYCTNTNTAYVSINPVMSFTLPEFLRSCKDNTVNINGPTGATGYTWTSTTGYTSTSPSNPNLVLSSVTPTQSGIYTLSVSLGPCVSSEEVEVEILTPVEFTLSPQNRTICRGDTSLFEVGAAGGSQVYAFNWTPFNYLSSPTGSFVTGNVLGTTVFNVQVYDVACPTLVKSHPFTVVVKQPPSPDLQLTNLSGCSPLCMRFNSRTQADVGIITYDFGGFKKRQGDDFDECFTEPGSYNLRIYTEGLNGCHGIYDHPVPLVVYPKAQSEVRWSPEIPNSTDNIVTFNAVSKTTTVANYDWMFTGTNSPETPDVSDQKNPQRQYEQTGKYPVMLISTTEMGCVDTTVAILEIKDDLNVYIPNSFTPNNDGVNDVFMVKGLGFKTENFILEVYDRWGHQVFTTKDVSKGWDGAIKGQTPSEGVYIYKVKIVGANGEGRKEYVGNVTLLR